MTKTTRSVIVAAFATLMLILSVLLGTFLASDVSGVNESDLSYGLTADEAEKLELIDEDGRSNYTIIFSTDTITQDYDLSMQVQYLFINKGIVTVNIKSDMLEATPKEKEILIGFTNREESTFMLARLERACKNSDDLAWGYAVIGGKLVYAANSDVAFEYGMEDFIEFLTECDMSVPMDTNVIETMTMAEHEELLRQKAEAERQAIIDELLAKNEVFKDESRLTEGYKSMIGSENAHYDKSPYQAPWVYPAENQHPRYLITETNVERIKEMMNDPEYENLFIDLWKWAKIDISEGVFPEKTGGSGQVNRYSETILRGISARAMAYLLTGDEIYGYEAIIAIKNAMLTLKYTTDIHMDVYHGASHVMVVLAAVYDWCYDLLTEEDKWQMITGSVNCLWTTMEFNYPPNDYNGISGHGTGPQLLRDYISLAIAFYDEAPDWWEFVGGRYFQEYLPVANEQYANGWVSQGTACYAPIKVMVQLWSAHLIKITTGELFFTEDAKLGVQMFISQIQPNGYYFQTGDGGRTAYGSKPGFAEYFVSAALYNDPVALSWAKYLTNNYTKVDQGSIFTMTSDFQLCFISHVTAEKEEIYDSIGLVQYFLDPAGQMTARDTWEEDGAAVFMKVGNMSGANHDVYEHGTFQIYYKGLLAADSGSYKHYGGDSHYYYLQCTVAHNGLLIFNPSKAGDKVVNASGKITNPGVYYYSGSQRRLASPSTLQQWLDGTYRMADTTGAAWGYNLDGSTKFAYLAGDITAAYDEATVNYVGRRMLTVYTNNPEVPMMFFVFDEIVSDKENYEKTFLLHTINEPEVDTENMSATVLENGGRLVLNSLYGADVIEKIGGEGKAYWINGYYKEDGTWVEGKNCLDEYTPDDNYQNIWGRIQLRKTGELSTTFLNAMYVTDAESTATLTFDKYQNEYVYGATSENTVVMFAAGREKAYKGFSFQTEGTGLHNYYISGVADGTWQVKVDGVSVAYALSSDESGIIDFVAPCGDVELIPGPDVIGANGGKIQYNSGGAILPKDAPYSYNNETATPLPTTAVRGEDVFLGWYLTSECLPEDRVYEVPQGYTGTFRVYAKWLATFVNEDYTSTDVLCNAGNVTHNGINYAGNGKPGSSFRTKKDENGVKYLEWIEGESDSFIHAQNNASNMSTAVSEDKSISFTVTIAAEPDKPIIASSFQMVAKENVNGAAINSVHTKIFSTSASGQVLLGGSKAIMPITSEPTTVRIAIDFKYGQFKAYDEEGTLLASVAFRPDGNTGAKNTEELMECYTQYLFYWHGDSSADKPDSTLRIYKIKMQDGNIFEGGGGAVGDNSIVYNKNGGSIPAGSPYTYNKDEITLLPTDVKREGYLFDGWYTTETFDEGTRTYFVPAGTKGAYTVYAKWRYLIVDETYEGASVNIPENSSTSVGSLSYNAGSAGEAKPGSSFISEKDEAGNTYLKMSVGSVNSVIYKTDSNFNLTHFTETAISYEFDLRKLQGIDFPNVTLQIASAGGSYGTLRVLTIDEAGNAKLAGSSVVFTKIGEEAYTTLRITIDFEASTIFAYDAEGNILDSVRVTSVPSGNKGAPATLGEWQKVAAANMFYAIINRTDKTEGKVSSLAIDNIVVAEGRLFEYEEVVLPVGSGIVYKTDGGTLPKDAPTEYDPDNGTLLPTNVSRPGYVFGGWYTDEQFSADSRVHYVPAGTEGTFKVYAKWLNVLAEEDYTGKNFAIEGSTQSNGAISYNAVNAGCRHEVVTDAGGNSYIKFTNTGTNNGIAYVYNTGYNLSTFEETSISYEFELKKLEGYDLSNASLILVTPGADNVGNINLATMSNGAFKLIGSSVVIATVGEESFTKFRITVDFAEGTVYAYDENYDVLDSAKLTVPTNQGNITAAQWQKLAKNYLFYLSFNKQNTAIAYDNIKVIEGKAFEKPVTTIPSRTSIEYITGGATLPEGAPTEYDSELGTLLPADITRPGYVFGGWYTTPDFVKGTEAQFVPAGTTGAYKVYAKWLNIYKEEDYTGNDFVLDKDQPDRDGIVYNALNAGVSFETKTDANGNTYLVANNAVENAAAGNSVIRITDSGYNLKTFEEPAVTYEFKVAKAEGVKLSKFSLVLIGVNGDLGVANSDAEGNVRLAGSNVVIANIVEGSFTNIRISVDFTTGLAYAYNDEGDVVDSVAITLTAGFSSLAEWRTSENGAKTHIFFISLFNTTGATEDTALLIDDIRITEGLAVRKALDKLPLKNNIEYVVSGGKLPADAPTDYLTEEGVDLPTPTRVDSVFAGWYTTETFDEGTRVYRVEAGTEGTVKLYAKWLSVVKAHDYTYDDFVFDERKQNESLGMNYNTVNEGVSMRTETDAQGNKYIKVENAATAKNGVIYNMNNNYNLTHFTETAISYQFDLAKIKDVQLSRFGLSIQTGGSAYGGLDILYVKEKTGEIILGSAPEYPEGEEPGIDAPPAEGEVVVGNVTEEFTTIRVTVDFEASVIIAYDADGAELGRVTIDEVPVGTEPQVESMLEWQKVAKPYVFYGSVVRYDETVDNSGIIFDNLYIVEGRAFN